MKPIPKYDLWDNDRNIWLERSRAPREFAPWVLLAECIVQQAIDDHRDLRRQQKRHAATPAPDTTACGLKRVDRPFVLDGKYYPSTEVDHLRQFMRRGGAMETLLDMANLRINADAVRDVVGREGLGKG